MHWPGNSANMGINAYAARSRTPAAKGKGGSFSHWMSVLLSSWAKARALLYLARRRRRRAAPVRRRAARVRVLVVAVAVRAAPLKLRIARRAAARGASTHRLATSEPHPRQHVGLPSQRSLPALRRQPVGGLGRCLLRTSGRTGRHPGGTACCCCRMAAGSRDPAGRGARCCGGDAGAARPGSLPGGRPSCLGLAIRAVCPRPAFCQGGIAPA